MSKYADSGPASRNPTFPLAYVVSVVVSTTVPLTEVRIVLPDTAISTRYVVPSVTANVSGTGRTQTGAPSTNRALAR